MGHDLTHIHDLTQIIVIQKRTLWSKLLRLFVISPKKERAYVDESDRSDDVSERVRCGVQVRT